MNIKSICFICAGYPSEYRVVNAFVENLVNEITDKGVECVVISPQSITNVVVHKNKMIPYKSSRKTPRGNKVTVYTPKYISLSTKRISVLNTSEVTLANFRSAAVKVFEKIYKEHNFDAVYGHFIFEAGITAAYIGKKYKIPSFLAYGENTTYTIDYLGADKTRKLLSNLNGVVSVSTVNKKVLIDNNIVSSEKIDVFPNAINSKVFFKTDKSEARKKLGFPQDKFIVIFVGRLLEVKGPKRLSAAIDNINDDIYSIFIGEGKQIPDCRNILFCDTVQHDELNLYLNAADIFVLPTLAEGCCNAIIEAMACGLPVISSNLPFNDDILDDSCSIRVNPNDINEIAEAIKRLKNDEELRNNMAEQALKKAQSLQIDVRADKILKFMSECIDRKDGENNG